MLEVIWGILAIILIDIVLGGENAVVIAMASKNLPPNLRKKAILWGTFGAIAVRFACIAVLTWLLLIPGLKVIGGLALLYIGWKLTAGSGDHVEVKSSTTLMGALGTIVLADAVMGLDNALAIAAAAGGNWTLIIFGLLVSVPVIIFGSTVIARVIDKHPDAIYFGSFVLYVVAFKMIMTESFVANHIDPLDEWNRYGLPWVCAIVLTAKQYYHARILRPKSRLKRQ